MIRDVAGLLTALQLKELEAIQRSGITHAPTIGAQYEGLTSTILGKMIPTNLELEVVSGFVEGVDSMLSGQIDCMLVRGSGTPLPQLPGQYKWPIKDVLAVFEVKKTLFGGDLADAHDQLQSVMDLFWTYAAAITPLDGIEVDSPRYVYSQITGEPAPRGKQFDKLPFDKEALYRMLIADHVAPVRIILGYGGYKSEHSLRQGFLNVLLSKPLIPGYAGSSLPSLVVCGENSIIKANGEPFYFRQWSGKYLCYASSGREPILWMLNLILTRIGHLFASPDWYARDLSIDRFAPLVWGKAGTQGQLQGWEYWEHPLSAKELERVPALSTEEWEPVPIEQNEAVLLGIIGNDGIAKADLIDAMKQIAVTEEQTHMLVQNLIDKRLVGWDSETLVFLTRRCTTAFTPHGALVAHDMEDERFVEWMMRDERWQRKQL